MTIGGRGTRGEHRGVRRRTVSQQEVDVLRQIADSGGPASERLAAAVCAGPSTISTPVRPR
jgi:hypothetical protein